MNITTKICGLTTPEAVEAAVDSGAAYLGFVFFPPSPRNLSPATAAALTAGLPAEVKTVAVCVNPSDDELRAITTAFTPHYLQLHGKETPDRVRAIKQSFPTLGIIKAISIRSGDDIAAAGAFTTIADMLLFDAKAPESSALPGGNGLAFDWKLLQNRHFALPWFLSGGLNAENVEDALRTSGAVRVDVSSGLESSPGVKSPELIRRFMTRIAAIA